ncbi:U1 zinc finger [Cryptosporidium sp. chipmunk genotype I]|uniref:U1 zinc finger n=1 Tax=Cryptosporidium sp. chipmunk genotype I TaxID=1280935 RepID=UPI00351A92F6|nr:U1 zinc finger [Cryptosporidium sp. chipmunk genotype I]
MPKFYCDYCDIYLTHSSTNGRKQHNLGRKHINNKIDHYKNVIKSPGFSAPLMFDSEYNVIGHLGNVRQFLQNQEKQFSGDKKYSNNNETKEKEFSKSSSYRNNKTFIGNINNNNNNNNSNIIKGGIGNANYNIGNSYLNQERLQYNKSTNVGGNSAFTNYGKPEHSSYSNNYSNYYRGGQIEGGDGGSRSYKKGPVQNYGGRY